MRVGWGAGLLALALLSAAPARAHLGHVIGSGERYLKLDVAGNSARVVVSLTLGAREGGRVLAAADTDSDGSVSEAERDAYLAQWASGLGDEVPVDVDGERVVLAWGEAYMDPIGSVAAVPVTVELLAQLELAGGRQTIRITDAMVRREIFDRTDVAFRARDGAELVASGTGDSVLEPTPDLAYGADFQRGRPVMLTAIVATPARPSDEPLWPWIAGILVLLAALIAWGAWRRRRGLHKT